jgi:hypothetical protein
VEFASILIVRSQTGLSPANKVIAAVAEPAASPRAPEALPSGSGEFQN